MRKLFGYIGTGLEVDVIDFDSNNKIVILRIAKRLVLFFFVENNSICFFLSKRILVMFFVFYSGTTALWSALTLTTTYENRPCYFQVLKVSPYLTSLANTSRSHSPNDYESL
jgi:hypothetical protein